MKKITKDIYIEELIENYPFSVNYLSKKGIRCIVCGEAIWGTLEDASKEKGFDDAAIEKFVSDLNDLNKKFEEKINIELNNIDTKKTDA